MDPGRPPAHPPTATNEPVSTAPASPPTGPDGGEALIRFGGIGLILLGILLLLAHQYTWFILFVLAGVLWTFVITPAVLRRQQVIERWDTLILDGAGQAETVIKALTTQLGQIQPPNLRLSQQDLAPGWLRGILGQTRPFVVVTQTSNPRLAPYRMYVSVRDYGTTLQPAWYLTYKPSFWRRARQITGLPSLGLDFFDEQDLRAAALAVHLAFLRAVVDLLATLGQETTNLNRSTKGFLGIN